MATNNDLDDFFKKKDRKGNRHKKQTGLLTNNEELLKQLVIVTSATSAFKENMDFEDEEDIETGVNNYNRQQTYDESIATKGNHEDGHTATNKSQPYSTTVNNKSKNTTKLSVQDNNNLNEQQTGGGQQDEWEEFEDSNSKYKQLRLKFSRANNGNEDENEVDYYDDENNPINHEANTGDDTNNIDGGDDDDQTTRTNRRREQQKDKPVWKLDQVKQTEPIPTNEPTISAAEKVEEPSVPKPATTSGAYRPPQLRTGTSVTIVSGVNQRPSKKEKPNLASTEDFPTLGAAVNKK
jgi:hypothetical protein